ncbi:COG2426 family protein [Candidatus Bipolaricaulota bacterium]
MSLWNAVLAIGISAAPVFELRGGIPLALSQGFPPAGAFGLALLGNLAVVPLLLWGFEWMEQRFMRWRFTRAILEWVFTRSRRKGRWIQRLGSLGLVLLVAIPLPGTGAWTGAIASRLLGIPVKKALPWIAIGVVIAGILVLFASLGAIRLFGVSGAA